MDHPLMLKTPWLSNLLLPITKKHSHSLLCAVLLVWAYKEGTLSW